MRPALTALIITVFAAFPAYAEPLSYGDVLERALANDAALQIARLELERARLESVRVESQLGWVASGQAGVARDVNLFGVPVDRVDAGAGVERRLQSGSSVGVNLGVVREESETTIFPFLPNPQQTFRADANYRLPLAQGSGNVGYREGLEAAEAGVQAAQAQWSATRDSLAQQVAQLYYAAAFTYARLRNAEDAIERAERLQNFVLKNYRLGIAEDKDRLQADAQLRGRLTERQALRAAWENQRIALNRLMERAWESEWQPRVDAPPVDRRFDVPAIQAQVARTNPELERERARLRLAESAIARRRDAARDRVDLVFSLGNRTISGDVATGSTSNAEAVAGVRVEYRAALDRRGADAELTQALIERDIARRRIDATETNIAYNVAQLVAEIDAVAAALEQARARKEVERRKLEEATRRHRAGRANTAELIQFENDYEAAALAVEQQAIELARRYAELERLRGTLWDRLAIAPMEPTETRP